MKKSIRDVNVAGKRVLVRVDFNVPLDNGIVQDNTRIKAALPTINYLCSQGARVILITHLGRPEGVGFEQKYSTQPIVGALSELINRPVSYVKGLVGPEVEQAVNKLVDGEILLLENVRFDKREGQNNPDFAGELAKLADIYVNDAFGASHRTHASIAGVAQLLPSVCGELLASEVKTITNMLSEPEKPFVAILGGSKVSDKIGVIDNLLTKVDALLIGGGMCFTFLKAQGYSIGTSLCEDDWIERAAQVLEDAKSKNVQILLPEDIVAADKFSRDARIATCSVSEIPDDMMGLDIGPVSAQKFAETISSARTIFWNGPMGVFEIEAFSQGTEKVARVVAANKDAVSIIGGGDSVAAINLYGLADEVSFISTGGGASMRLVEGKKLPGLEGLDDMKEGN